MKTIINSSLTAACAVALLVASGASNAAPGNGQGPRGSVAAATVCQVDGSDFLVEIRVRDKTSGSATAAVAAWSASAIYKDTGNWNNASVLATNSASSLTLAVPTTIAAGAFSLCSPAFDSSGQIVGYEINPDIAGAKGLNVNATVTYGTLSGTSVNDQRTIMNSCSDDLDTLDVVEPEGIKLTWDVLVAISDACLAKPVPTP